MFSFVLIYKNMEKKNCFQMKNKIWIFHTRKYWVYSRKPNDTMIQMFMTKQSKSLQIHVISQKKRHHTRWPIFYAVGTLLSVEKRFISAIENIFSSAFFLSSTSATIADIDSEKSRRCYEKNHTKKSDSV